MKHIVFFAQCTLMYILSRILNSITDIHYAIFYFIMLFAYLIWKNKLFR